MVLLAISPSSSQGSTSLLPVSVISKSVGGKGSVPKPGTLPPRDTTVLLTRKPTLLSDLASRLSIISRGAAAQAGLINLVAKGKLGC